MNYRDAARDRLDLLIDHALRLVACESPSGDPGALERSAGLVAMIGAAYFGVRGEVVTRDGVPHVRWRLGHGPRRVLVLGHHDTVWPVGSLQRLPAVADGGALRGPGSYDMKTGLVQAFLACALVRERPGGLAGVSVLVTGDGEAGSATARALIERESAGCAAVLVPEGAGPGGELLTARKGVARYRLEVVGRAAHPGLEPERGVNAGLELAAQIPVVAGLGDASVGTTVVPTAGSIGTSVNTVPDTARVAVDVRARTDAELARVDAALRGLTPRTPGARLVLHGGVTHPPMPPSADLFALAAASAAALGLDPPADLAVGAASDGNFTAAAGVPTLDGLGAVGGGAHTPDEHVLIAPIADRVALFAHLLDRLLAG
ncbi:M20/M25/M40 family metallo-hydrolase [Actinosynnema sp. NPDC047251]|uniref:Putative peptidase n=1 Tax=Saccharothrix espanaensis (strain ATCC 51144 / DSM 44229 / JCM 9112 / NBRC 15066 / NRRL 15764) TaxID=1179773 RepID=K0JXS9_SACES|nr:M20/M25/M40 family metallo-hydrolase [Saccharothrix espanaensis]CCH30102.1 putative peptidase [Saccharothrix espanaensis DSM 44229]